MSEHSSLSYGPVDVAAFHAKLAEWVTALSPMEQSIFEAALRWVASQGPGDVTGYASEGGHRRPAPDGMTWMERAFRALQ